MTNSQTIANLTVEVTDFANDLSLSFNQLAASGYVLFMFLFIVLLFVAKALDKSDLRKVRESVPCRGARAGGHLYAGIPSKLVHVPHKPVYELRSILSCPIAIYLYAKLEVQWKVLK